MYKKQSPVPKKLKSFKGIFIYGHRGLLGHKSENTMSSFSYAINAKVNGIELDVQKIKSGELIVFHDESLYKINGNHKPISDYNFSELKRIDISKKWDVMKNQSIPQLIDVIDLIPKNMILNVEIKSYQSSKNDIVCDIINLIDYKNLYENVIISSFDPIILFKIKKLNNKIPISLIWNGKTKFAKTIVKLLKPSTFHMHSKYITTEIINWMHNRNTQVYAYTINNEKDYLKGKTMNLDGIFTDIDLFMKKQN